MNSILDLIRELKKGFDGKFIITHQVEYEIVQRPMTIKKYKLGALKVKSLIDEGILEFPESLKISNKEIEDNTQDILKQLNAIFYANNHPVHLIDLGEASILALNSLLNKKGMQTVIAIDERTTRMLIEKPENLHKLMEEKLGAKINIKSISHPSLKNVSFIRSSELIYVAYRKGLVKDKEMLDAMLYGAKFKGCSISFDEIKEIESMA